MKCGSGLAGVVLCVGLVASDCCTASEPGVDFAKEIQPLFAKRCFSCHGPNVSEGGLRLSSRPDALAELDSGSRADCAR